LFFSQETVLAAITALVSIEHNFTRTTGNADLLSYYLILKKLNMSCTQWTDKSIVFEDKEKTLASLWQLGGLFSESENAKKKCCLLFSSFSKKTTMSSTYFYNQGTEFPKLAGRFKDTVDNTAADYLLDKGLNDTYRFKSDVISIILNNYTKKFSLDALAIWTYRTLQFEKTKSLQEIKKQFIDEFKINSEDSRKLFETSNIINHTFQDSPINHKTIRTFLNSQDICEISHVNILNNHNFNPSNLDFKSLYNGAHMINDSTKVKSLLDKSKQVVLTGVPGTGKSHMIEQLREFYDDIKIVQFHQNYSYQDFIIGKTIESGDVVVKKGELLSFIESLETDKRYLLVLDEINRGNLSSIFGEALYALDRGNMINVGKELASDNQYELSIPDNLHILGTMNSADRSIAIIDFAIRRRFLFVELKPDYDLIDRHVKINDEEILGNFLRLINEKIISFFENSDYLLGHSYFLTLSEPSIEDIYDILHYKIIPMLIEYDHGEQTAISHIFPEGLLNANSDELIEQIKAFINE